MQLQAGSTVCVFYFDFSFLRPRFVSISFLSPTFRFRFRFFRQRIDFVSLANSSPIYVVQGRARVMFIRLLAVLYVELSAIPYLAFFFVALCSASETFCSASQVVGGRHVRDLDFHSMRVLRRCDGGCCCDGKGVCCAYWECVLRILGMFLAHTGRLSCAYWECWRHRAILPSCSYV